MNVGHGFLAPRNVEVATARCARADENGIPVFGQQGLQAVDAPAAAKLHAEIEDVAAFLVDDGFGQPEAGNLRADHAAGLRILIEHHAVIAERREVACDRE